jgi:hypothetical protein
MCQCANVRNVAIIRHQRCQSVFDFGRPVTGSCAAGVTLSVGSLPSLVDYAQREGSVCPCQVAVMLKESSLEHRVPSAEAMPRQHRVVGCYPLV